MLVSHNMRLISQVAKEIWICDKKKVERYNGDILKFKLAAKKVAAEETHAPLVNTGDSFCDKNRGERCAPGQVNVARRPAPVAREAPAADAGGRHEGNPGRRQG